MSFSSWIASLRLEEAKKMMSEHPDAKLKDIAYNVGFSSLPYFSSISFSGFITNSRSSING